MTPEDGQQGVLENEAVESHAELDIPAEQPSLHPATATVIGAFYCAVLASSLTWGVKSMSPRDAPDTHYVLNSLAWLTGTILGGYLAAILSRSARTAVAVISIIPASLVWILVISESDSVLPAILGWEPPAYIFGTVLLVLSIIGGVLAGSAADSAISRIPDRESYTDIARNVNHPHWWWLWIPISVWAGLVPGIGYLLWLAIATGWHWIFHPSLWFSVRWFFFLSIGITFTYLPYTAFATGVQIGLSILAHAKPRGQRIHIALHFLLWGIGCAVGATLALSFVGFWILEKLPIASEKAPWWMVFH
jgi:hypothetical protein